MPDESRWAGVAARQVFRTDVTQPGFAHLDLGTTPRTPESFDDLLRKLATELAEIYRLGFGRELSMIPQGTFDQQVTTGAHRDGGADESFLLLGYEPTSVPSRLLLLDFSRAAQDWGQTPAEFLERFNPLLPEGRRALDGYQTELTGFDPSHYHAVLINNSLGSEATLGVLHQGIILRPDPTARRLIHSLMLSVERGS